MHTSGRWKLGYFLIMAVKLMKILEIIQLANCSLAGRNHGYEILILIANLNWDLEQHMLIMTL